MTGSNIVYGLAGTMAGVWLGLFVAGALAAARQAGDADRYRRNENIRRAQFHQNLRLQDDIEALESEVARLTDIVARQTPDLLSDDEVNAIIDRHRPEP